MSEQGKAEREVLVPVWNKPEPYFVFSEEQKKRFLASKLNPWRVVPNDKRQPTHRQASTCDSLLNVYSNAIEIGAPFGAIPAGVGIFFGLMCLIGMVLFSGISYKVGGDVYFMIFLLPVIIGLFLASAFFFRVAIFSPRDFPVLFNRKNRDVNYLMPKKLSFLKFWQGVRLRAGRMDWNDLQVRSYKYVEFTSKTAHDSYNLSMIHGSKTDPRRVEAVVDIGYKGWWEDERLFRLWEHIRRYMEEDGPPIQRGETLRDTGHGKLPTFSAEVIAAAGGPALSVETVAALAGSAPAPTDVDGSMS